MLNNFCVTRCSSCSSQDRLGNESIDKRKSTGWEYNATMLNYHAKDMINIMYKLII